jgi:hypothetical protein
MSTISTHPVSFTFYRTKKGGNWNRAIQHSILIFYFCNGSYFITELTRIGIETVKKELAEGKVPKVPKAEQHEAKKVQTFGNWNCSFGKGFQVFGVLNKNV